MLQKYLVLFFILMSTLICLTVQANQVESFTVEGNDLKITHPCAKHEYLGVFSGNVNMQELSPETICKLLDHPEKSYPRETLTKLIKIDFWQFPMVVFEDKSLVEDVFSAGKLQKKSTTVPERYNSILLEILLRIIPSFCIFSFSLFYYLRNVNRKSLIIIFFYAAIISVVLIGGLVGTSMSWSVSLTIGMFVGAIIGAITGTFTDTSGNGLKGGTAGGFSGFLAGGSSGVFASQMGWQNAAINDYLIFLSLVCLVSFILSNLAFWAKRQHIKHKVEAT